MKRTLKNILLIFFAVAALAACGLAAAFGAEQGEAAKWSDDWAYQWGMAAGTPVDVDANGSLVTSDEITSAPTIFQFEGLDGKRNPKPTSLNGLKMTFTIQLTQETPEYRLDGTFQDTARAGLFNGWFLIVPKPQFYGAGANDFVFGTGIWADNFTVPDTLRFVNASYSAGNPTWTGGTVTSAKFFVTGQDNVLEVRYEGGQYRMFVNGVHVGEMSAADAAVHFPKGEGYMILQLNDTFGPAKLTVKELTAPEAPEGETLEAGSEETVLAEAGVSGGYRQASAITPAVVYSKDNLNRPFFREYANMGFGIRRVDETYVTGSEIRFFFAGLGYAADGGFSSEIFSVSYCGAGGKTFELRFARTDETDPGTAVVAYYDGAEVGAAQSGIFYTDGATENVILLAKRVGGYSLTVNGEAIVIQKIDEIFESDNFADGRASLLFAKESKGGETAENATLTLIGYRDVAAAESLPETIVAENDTTAYLADMDGKGYVYNLSEQDFAVRYTEYKLLANSFAATFRLDRSGEGDAQFDLILSSRADARYTEGSAVLFRFERKGGNTAMKILLMNEGTETVVLETEAGQFQWNGRNYVGLAYSNDDSGWIYALDDAQTYIPVAMNAEQSAKLSGAIASFAGGYACLAAEGGAGALTSLHLERVDYFVRRGVAAPNWSTNFNVPPVWGYFSEAGEAVLGSTGLTTWYTTMPTAKVPVKGFRMEFDVYTQASAGGLYFYLSSSTLWYAQAPAAVGIAMTRVDDETARIAFSKTTVVNGTFVQKDTPAAEMAFSWKGRNVWEIKQDADGLWQYYLNGEVFVAAAEPNEEGEPENAPMTVDSVLTDPDFIRAFEGSRAQATLQIFNNNTDSTVIVRDLPLLKPNSRPRVTEYISDFVANKTFEAGKEFTLDLSAYFEDSDEGDSLTFTASAGTVEGTVFRFTPEEVSDGFEIRITATDSEGSTAVQIFKLKIVEGTGGGCNSSLSSSLSLTLSLIAGIILLAGAVVVRRFGGHL